MNSTQRKYLCDKITEKVKAKIKDLESQRVATPSLSSYMLHEVLSDRFKIKSNEELREIILNKAKEGVTSDRPDRFLADSDRWGSNTDNRVVLKIEDFFVLPENYQEVLNVARQTNIDIQIKINQLKIQAETLETRIMLASDKTLEKMINEVDDMGEISLIDTKLKLIS
jgi:hypothetical protein